MMKNSVDYIKNRIKDFNPEVGIILGSGLGDFADRVGSVAIRYENIPGFESSKVQGHKGQLVFAEIENKKVVMMQGRYHFYEGYSPQVVSYPVKILKLLGVKTLIVTNAAGSINKNFLPGDFMIIEDHINFTGTNPLIGTNDDEFGPRFPDMSDIYKKKLRDKVKSVAKSIGIDIKEGVYAGMSGPSYETPAEIRMLQIIGAQAVGMSTVFETITAAYCGIEVVGISCLTNYAAGVSDTPLNHQEVIETADKVKNNFKRLILGILKTI